MTTTPFRIIYQIAFTTLVISATFFTTGLVVGANKNQRLIKSNVQDEESCGAQFLTKTSEIQFSRMNPRAMTEYVNELLIEKTTRQIITANKKDRVRNPDDIAHIQAYDRFRHSSPDKLAADREKIFKGYQQIHYLSEFAESQGLDFATHRTRLTRLEAILSSGSLMPGQDVPESQRDQIVSSAIVTVGDYAFRNTFLELGSKKHASQYRRRSFVRSPQNVAWLVFSLQTLDLPYFSELVYSPTKNWLMPHDMNRSLFTYRRDYRSAKNTVRLLKTVRSIAQDLSEGNRRANEIVLKGSIPLQLFIKIWVKKGMKSELKEQWKNNPTLAPFISMISEIE